MKVKIYILLCFLTLWSGSIAQINWEVDPSRFEYSMTVTAVLSQKDTLIENMPGFIIGAFNKDTVCVGKGESMYFDKVQKYRIPMMIFSNNPNEIIHLFAYHPDLPQILLIKDSIQFKIDEIQGNYALPVVWKIGGYISAIDQTGISTRIEIRCINQNLQLHCVESDLPLKLRLLDSSGKILLNRSVTRTTEYVDLSEFPDGIYLVNIVSEKEIFNEKIVLH